METTTDREALYQAEATRRLERALALIERAQNDLASACGELSTLEHGVPSWKATSTMCDRVKALWWKVHHFRMARRYRLDQMHRDALDRKLAEGR